MAVAVIRAGHEDWAIRGIVCRTVQVKSDEGQDGKRGEEGGRVNKLTAPVQGQEPWCRRATSGWAVSNHSSSRVRWHLGSGLSNHRTARPTLLSAAAV